MDSRMYISWQPAEEPGARVHVVVGSLFVLPAEPQWVYIATDEYSLESIGWHSPGVDTETHVSFLERLTRTLPYRVRTICTDGDPTFSGEFDCACLRLGIQHLAGYRHLLARTPLQRLTRWCDSYLESPAKALQHLEVDVLLQLLHNEVPQRALAGQTPVQRREEFQRRLAA